MQRATTLLGIPSGGYKSGSSEDIATLKNALQSFSVVSSSSISSSSLTSTAKSRVSDAVLIQKPLRLRRQLGIWRHRALLPLGPISSLFENGYSRVSASSFALRAYHCEWNWQSNILPAGPLQLSIVRHLDYNLHNAHSVLSSTLLFSIKRLNFSTYLSQAASFI